MSVERPAPGSRKRADRRPGGPLGPALAEIALAGDHEQALESALSGLDPRPRPIWLAFRSGRLLRASDGFRPDSPEVSPAELAELWKERRGAQVVLAGRCIGIPLPHTSPDVVDGELAEEMLVLEFLDRSQSELFTERVASPSTLERFGRLLAERRYGAIDQRIGVCAREILFASQSGRPADACQAVAEAIRDVTAFDGRCLILRVQGADDPWSGADGALEVVTLLAAASPGETASVAEVTRGPVVHWRPQPGARLTDTDGRSFFIARMQADSRRPIIEIDRYEVVTGEPGGTERLVARPGLPPGTGDGKSFEADRPIRAVRALLSALHEAGLLDPGSSVTTPLFDAGTLQGFIVTSSPGRAAFSGRDAVRIGELGLLAVRTLARERRLESDFGQLLGNAATLSGASPVAGNRQLRDLLTALCERLRRVTRADSVLLLPYDHKRDALIETAVAHAGRWADAPASPHRRRRGLVATTLEKGEWEWSITSGERFDPESFVGRHDIGRFCAVALRSTSGAAVGVLICSRAITPEQMDARDAGRGAQDDPEGPPRAESTSAELRRMREFGRIAAAFLQRQNESSSLAMLQDELFDLYGRLLVETGRAFASDSAEIPRKIRDDLLERVLRAAIEIVGGTTGVFMVPSFEHDGLDPVARIGGDSGPERISYGQGTSGACALQGLVQVIPDSNDERTWPPGVLPIRRVKGAKSEMAYPVQDSQRRLLGVIDLENEITTGAFVEADAALVLQPLAQAATLVIQLTDSIAHLASIARLSRALDDAQARSEEEIALVTLKELREVTGAFSATARVPDQRGEFLKDLAHAGEPGKYTGQTMPLDLESANGAAYNEGRVVQIDDVRTLWIGPVRSRRDYLPAHDETRSEIVLPVTHHSRMIGVLDLDHRQPRAFVASEAYLRVVARQFGHALSARRDSERRLMAKSHDMLKVLNSYYARINHSIASRFTAIRHGLEDLERRFAERGVALRDDLREVYGIAENGVRDADGLLAASAGSYEEEREFDVRLVLLSAVPPDQQDRFEVANVAREPVWVYGREQMLRWVFREVIANSLKYGGDDVRVSLSLNVDDQRGCAIAVLEDDGRGIVDEDRFDDLFTVRGRDRYREKGGGGLALVGARAFLETMRGSIEAAPAEPSGLRTTITLPVYRDHNLA